jgi:hypothetical protein
MPIGTQPNFMHAGDGVPMSQLQAYMWADIAAASHRGWSDLSGLRPGSDGGEDDAEADRRGSEACGCMNTEESPVNPPGQLGGPRRTPSAVVFMNNRAPSATTSLVARTSSRRSASPCPPSLGRRLFLQILLGGSLAFSAASTVGCSGTESGAWQPSTIRGSRNRGHDDRGGDSGGNRSGGRGGGRGGRDGGGRR